MKLLHNGLVDRSQFPSKEEIYKYMPEGMHAGTFEWRCKAIALAFHDLADLVDDLSRNKNTQLLTALNYYADPTRYRPSYFDLHTNEPSNWEFDPKTCKRGFIPPFGVNRAPWSIAQKALDSLIRNEE